MMVNESITGSENREQISLVLSNLCQMRKHGPADALPEAPSGLYRKVAERLHCYSVQPHGKSLRVA